MKAKEYLSQIPDLRRKIANKSERLERLHGLLTSPAVGELTPDKVQTSIDLHKQENLIAEKSRLEAELGELMRKEAAILLETGKQIDQLQNTLYARILHLRYEEGYQLGAIADIIGYSYEYIRHLHGSALEAFTNQFM